MKILGNRLLLSKVEEEKKEGFQTVDVIDSFVYKGKVEQIGLENEYIGTSVVRPIIEKGTIVLFAKYSPDTQEIDHDGQKMKIVKTEDILAIYE